MSVGGKIFEARHPHNAEIDQLERAFAFEDDIVRLDVTVDDAGVVQRRDRARQLDGDVAPFLQAQCGTPRQPCFQKFALIERHHRVETGLPAGWQFNRTANPWAVHPRTHPGLADEGGTVSIHGRDLWLGKFQRYFAAFTLIQGAEQARVASVGHQHFEDETIDRFAVDRHWNKRQLHDRRADIRRFCCWQFNDIDHQRGAIVSAARFQRSGNESARRILGCGTLAQSLGNRLSRQKGVHAVTAQKKPIMPGKRLGRIIERHFCFDAERTDQCVRAAAGTGIAHMVVRETSQAIAAQAVDASVTDMQQMCDAPAQDQRRERATHPREFCVSPALRMYPAVERVEDLGAGAAHLHCLGQVAEPVEKTAHRHLGGDTTALGAADAIGDSRDHISARLWQFRTKHRTGEVLVALPRPGFRGKPYGRLNAGKSLRHHRGSRSVAAASSRSFVEFALIIKEIAASRRSDDDRKLS